MNTLTPPIGGEKAILLIRSHWMQFFPAVFLVALSWALYVLCGVLAAFVAAQNHALAFWIVLIGHLFLLLFHHTAFSQYLNISTRQLLLTDRRIIGSQQRLWTSDDTLDIPLYRIRSIEAKEEGIVQHLLRYGTLVLNQGEMPSLSYIPRPDSVHDHVMAQVQQLLPASFIEPPVQPPLDHADSPLPLPLPPPIPPLP